MRTATYQPILQKILRTWYRTVDVQAPTLLMSAMRRQQHNMATDKTYWTTMSHEPEISFKERSEGLVIRNSGPRPCSQQPWVRSRFRGYQAFKGNQAGKAATEQQSTGSISKAITLHYSMATYTGKKFYNNEPALNGIIPDGGQQMKTLVNFT